MKYQEYGKENSKVIILLHGGGLSWWNYREVAELLQRDFHVILPVLDGHAESDCDFTTIEDNAKEIISFIEQNLNGSVFCMGGLSLGAQVLLEILSIKKDICQYALVESALVIPSKLTYSMIKPAFGSSYGLIQKEWFSKLQFKSLKMKDSLYPDYYRDSCAITKENLIAFMEENSIYSLKESLSECLAKVAVYVGAKENKAMLKSAEMIKNKLVNSRLTVLPNLYHGEFSINHAEQYVNAIYQLINDTFQ